MSWLSEIFEGGAEGVFKGIDALVARWKANPVDVMKHDEVMSQLQAALDTDKLKAEVAFAQAQNKVNEVEAASSDKFASRWRPAAGWLGVIGLAYSVIVYPLLTWASVNFKWIPPPALDVEVLVTLLMGMLGLGGMRTYEKTQGVKK